MDVPDHPRDITIGNRPIGERPGPYIESARTDHERVQSSYLYVDVPPDGRRHALRLMISTMSLRGKRYVEVAQLHYRSDRQALVRYLAALEPDAAAQGIDDARRIRERTEPRLIRGGE